MAAILEDGPLNPEHLHMIVESEFHVALSEDVLPSLQVAEMPNNPKASPFNSTMTPPEEDKVNRFVELIVGLSKEKCAINFGEYCELDTSRLRRPSNDDEVLQSIAEADTHIDAEHAENPMVAEGEYPCNENILPNIVTRTEPELGAFLPWLERISGALNEKANDKYELCIAAEAIRRSAAETPEVDLHLTEVSERKLEATKADTPSRNLSEYPTFPKEAPKMVMDCMPVETPLVRTDPVTLGTS